MAIRIYNTLSKIKEPFETLQPGKVGIYLCGPTVYKPSHIGHMVGPVIFDTIKRYLVYCGYDVTLVINVTDIDDKLINESRTRGITMAELAREMTDDYMTNLKVMGVETVDHFPRATDNIDDIIALTETLVERGFAYVAEGGDVYFEVGKDPEYGKLSHRSVEALVGEGGDMADRKRSAADFALWKGAKPGEPSWPSPWGAGRPGWHIECSAMSRRLLGESFDIHGGGLDLVFPHHENEIAQSECCHGKPQAKYWLHNGLMQAADEVGKVGGRNTRGAAADEQAEQEAGKIGGRNTRGAAADEQAEQEAGKIGKSKGASAFRDLLAKYPAETIRFFLLSTHYRRPIYYSSDRLDEVGTSLATYYRFFERYARVTGASFYDLKPPIRRSASSSSASLGAAERERYLETMDDDFNTGGAIGVLFDLVRLLNKFVDENKLEERDRQTPELMAKLREGAQTLRELAAILGLFREPVAQPGAAASDDLADGLMKLIIEIRADSRKKKDFATADKIRDALTALQVTLEDRPDGTGWKRGAP